MSKDKRQARVIGYALILLAVLVQVQATLRLEETAFRANAADIFIAVLAPFILFAFFKKFTRLIAIAGPQLLILVIAASALLSFSFFRGYEVISGLSSWAAIKYAGWYILLLYLALGVLIAVLAGSAGKERFALGFISFQIIVIFVYLATELSGHNWSLNEGGRLTGFAGNTNAMALYLICNFAMAFAYLSRSDLSRRWRIAVLMAAGILLAGILFTKSIAALFALVTVLLFALIIHVATPKRLAQVLAVGLIFWIAPQVISGTHSLVVNVIDKLSGIIVTSTASDSGTRDAGRYKATVRVRMDGYRIALAMWKEHPVFGAGLGVHLHRQSLDEKPEILVLQIHNTALWLLAETGLAGFLAMAGIFVVLFHKVWRLSRAPPGELDSGTWFQSAVLLILIGWAVMSLFHELMYQRVIWLFAGMALTAQVEPLKFWKSKPET